MKKIGVLFFTLWISAAQAVVDNSSSVVKTNPKTKKSTSAADCEAGTSQINLEVNSIRAKLLNTGDLWWDRNNAKYEAPKVDPPGSKPSINSIFAGAVWVSGYDAGNLKMAAQVYSTEGNEFWPGPIPKGNPSINKSQCAKWDRFFEVKGKEIDAFRATVASNGGTISESLIPDNIKYWPGLKNPHLLADKGLNVEEVMAPFYDANKDLEYTPTKGDYPIIGKDSVTYADQMIFWVLNDVGNYHTKSNAASIGIQMNCLAFAFQSSDELDYMTFYRYHIINKSNSKLDNTYMSVWLDPDLGNPNDDYVGCDTARGMAFVYNSDANDEDNAGIKGYGDQPPVLGIDFFEGPKDTSGKEIKMSSFNYYKIGADPDNGDVNTANQIRNHQEGKQTKGTPFPNGGAYPFNGNPGSTSAAAVSMCKPTPQTAADLRTVQNAGPFTLQPGAENYVTIGVVWVRPPVGAYNGCAVDIDAYLGKADDKAQALFDNNFKVADGPDAPRLAIRELDKELNILITNTTSDNKPFGNNINERYAEKSTNIPTGVTDSVYKFEGYKIYQLKDQTVSSSQLDDQSKAKLIKQCDVKNGVATITNFTYDATNKTFIPSTKVVGADAGIVHSLKVTDDLFQSEGNSKLANHKQYYFGAVAYAHNNFSKTTTTVRKLIKPNASNPSIKDTVLDTLVTVETQKEPYLQGRKNFYVYSGIPHISDPSLEGVQLNAVFGQNVQVVRITGQGAGGNNVELDTPSVERVLTNNFSDSVRYRVGYSPIAVKVVDPFAVKDADFELRLISKSNPDSLISKGATWELKDLTNNKTILSNNNISRADEQLIQDGTDLYGISLTVSQPDSIILTTKTKKNVYSVLSSDMTFNDITKQWFSFLKDDDACSYSDWIRSGATAGGPVVTNPPNTLPLGRLGKCDNFFDVDVTFPESKSFYDPTKEFTKILEGRIAPYCLTTNHIRVNAQDLTQNFVSNGPAFRWDRIEDNPVPPQNTLDSIASIDIVITSDKSKWTRCIVFETGEDKFLNEGSILNPSKGNSQKGQIRMTYSVDKDGSIDLIDTGRGWFPGYAINVETGERLNMAFGENSKLRGRYAANMVWDPSKDFLSPLGEAIMGNMQYMYVMNTRYDSGTAAQRVLLDNYNTFSGTALPNSMKALYRKIMYAGIPILGADYKLYDNQGNYTIPSDVKIRIRIGKPFRKLPTSFSSNYGDSVAAVYQFSTKGLAKKSAQPDVAKSALDLINVVPNPYYAYSFYETDQNSNIVKIVNLPAKCTVNIFTMDGNIIRTFKRDVPTSVDIEAGANTENKNLDNSIDWDLKNTKSVPVSSGLYYVHVEVPGVGQKVVKLFVAMRPTDAEAF